MRLAITQHKSTINRKHDQHATIQALGLKRIRHTVVHEDTPQIRGMLARVEHLVRVEEIE
jgi:large subunit ribosomal protein L30